MGHTHHTVRVHWKWTGSILLTLQKCELFHLCRSLSIHRYYYDDSVINNLNALISVIRLSVIIIKLTFVLRFCWNRQKFLFCIYSNIIFHTPSHVSPLYHILCMFLFLTFTSCHLSVQPPAQQNSDPLHL